jgi:hypothetical protein
MILPQMTVYLAFPYEPAKTRFGSRGVSAMTASMTITGKRSGYPPSSPSKIAIVNGRGKTAQATPAIPALTAWEILAKTQPT